MNLFKVSVTKLNRNEGHFYISSNHYEQKAIKKYVEGWNDDDLDLDRPFFQKTDENTSIYVEVSKVEHSKMVFLDEDMVIEM